MSQTTHKPTVIAIDGFSSCGKSTVAKSLARKLGFVYVDTGAMYRCVTLYAIENELISNEGVVDEPALKDVINELSIDFKWNPELEKNDTYLNSQLVEDKIRGLEVASNVSAISKIKFVRERLVQLQRDMGKSVSLVMDGRDIGTVVFPDAGLKIFMTADPKVRAQRRYDEMLAKGDKPSFDDIYQNVVSRDEQDQNRSESPLRKADDALLLDNSYMTREEQLQWICEKL